jgi:hypothetical protein
MTMTTTAIDPVFAAVSEHKALIKESNRLEKSFNTAMAKAEKKHGAPTPHGWPGEATISPFYDRWNRADRAERMARVEPTTISGAAALIAHTRREIVARPAERAEDWLVTALKAAASALTRMEAT